MPDIYIYKIVVVEFGRTVIDNYQRKKWNSKNRMRESMAQSLDFCGGARSQKWRTPSESNRTKLMIPESPARANGVASQRSHASASSRDLRIPPVQYRGSYLRTILTSSSSFCPAWPLGFLLNWLINSTVLWYNISNPLSLAPDLWLNYHPS